MVKGVHGNGLLVGMVKGGSPVDKQTNFLSSNTVIIRGYPYTRHLEMLDSRRPPQGRIVPEILLRVETPLVANEWERCLRNHPDGRYREYTLTGLRNGFRVGFQYHTLSPTSAQTNMLSAGRNQDRYLDRVIGPLSRQEVPGVHVSRFGVIEKPHQPGKYRLIVDLSHPEGQSVNDGIEADICTLSVDTAVARAVAHGSAARLSKFDVESWSQFTLRTDTYWGWSGKANCLWTQPYHSGCDQPQKSLTPWQMRCNGHWSRKALILFTTWMTS